jgi:hypothetical protein
VPSTVGTMPARDPDRHAAIVAELREAAADDRAATAAKVASAKRLRRAIATATRAGFTHREAAEHVGLSYQRVGQLAPPSRRKGTPTTRRATRRGKAAP